MFGSAPSCSSSSTAQKWPPLAAAISGVMSQHGVLISAPASTSSRTTSPCAADGNGAASLSQRPWRKVDPLALPTPLPPLILPFLPASPPSRP
eukprot:1888221-Prymnesium_polylepis.3